MTGSTTRSALPLSLLLAAAPALSGCMTPTPGLAGAVSDRLYLGRSIAGGGQVSEADWDGFMDAEILPRFPDGLTIWRAQGQWREARGAIVREPVVVVEVVGGPGQGERLVTVARAYKQRFAQQAVLRVTAPVQAALVE